jgi:hypothetical protein
MRLGGALLALFVLSAVPVAADFAIQAEEMLQPDARSLGNASDTELAETGSHRLLGAILWEGRRFLHYEHRTYWTADGGLTWKSHGWTETSGPKPPKPLLPEARLRTTGSGLYLFAGAGGAAAAAAFDPAKDDWARTDFGRVLRDAAALGCDAGALYLYDAAQKLSASGDDGLTWRTVAEVPPPEGGSLFDDIHAEGPRILLRFRRPYGIAAAAGSADGGKTWKRFPAGADVHLQGGCFHFIAGDSLRSECGPGGPDRAVAVPFGKLERVFRQEGGEVFALADSGLFHEDGGGAGWESVAAFPREAGWTLAGEMLSRQTREKVSWVSPGNAVVSLAPWGIARGRRRPGPSALPIWLELGRRPDGRALEHHTSW